MRTPRTLTALLLAAPLLGLLGGTASAEPYLPPGAPIPAQGVISIAGTVSPTVKAAPRRLTSPVAVRPTSRLTARR